MRKTSEFYFKESDRIANKDKYPPRDIEAIDRFLAQKDVSDFPRHAVLDNTSVRINAKPILQEYVKLHVLREYKKYYCPEHQNKLRELEISRRSPQKGLCKKCDTTYPLVELEPEVFYRRIRNPRLWSNSLASNLSDGPKQSWRKDTKFVISSSIALIAVAVNIVQGVTCNTSINVILPSTANQSTTVAEDSLTIVDEPADSFSSTGGQLTLTEPPTAISTDVATPPRATPSPTKPS